MPDNPALTYPISGRPDVAEMLEVAPGIFWIRMPIPIPGLEFINLWAIREEDGWTVVDTGTRSSKIQEWWRAIFAGGFEGRPVKRVLCTHFHPDHVGQAGFICGLFNAPLWMTLTDWTFGRMLSLEASSEVPGYVIDFYRRIGFGDDALLSFRERGSTTSPNPSSRCRPSSIASPRGTRSRWAVAPGGSSSAAGTATNTRACGAPRSDPDLGRHDPAEDQSAYRRLSG